ncbi:MAG: ribosome maturation factor RimP [Gammaproteobacteria bacterium]|nr:ribosome maturation factor RimP [Gammaproteobacteria bacterium]
MNISISGRGNQLQDLTALFEPVVESMGYELVGIEFHSSEHHGVLRIFIDHENGITVDDCAKVSRQISAVIDVEDPIEMAFDLEVSSPGLNRPLFKLSDFEKFSGKTVKIKLGVALNGRKNFSGVLQGVAENQLVIIDVDNEIYELPYQDIAKANLTRQI